MTVRRNPAGGDLFLGDHRHPRGRAGQGREDD